MDALKREECDGCRGVGVIAAGAWTTMSEAKDCRHCNATGEKPFSSQQLFTAAKQFASQIKCRERDDAKQRLGAEVQRLGLRSQEIETFSGFVWRQYDKPARGPGWS